MEEKTFEVLSEEFRKKIAPYKQGVADEFLKRKDGHKKAEVVDGLSPKHAIVATKLVDIQNKNGYFARRDLQPEEFAVIQALAQKHGISNKQAVSLLITNDRYMAPETVEIENLCNLIEDVFSVYSNHYDSIGAFPVNALSQESRDYLANKKIKLGLSDKLKIVLQEYLPEFSEIKIVDKSYKAVPRYRFKYNDAVARDLAVGLKAAYADEKNLVDRIFLTENKQDLDQLLAIIGERGISFEEFASKNAVRYTRCYSLQSVPAVLKMIESYYKSNGTYRGITTKDPYLRQKIDTTEKHTGCFSLRSFLDTFGIQNDVGDNGQMVTIQELKTREALLVEALGEIYKGGVIQEGFLKKYPDLYEECLNLATRKGFKKVDEYLAELNFERIKHHDKQASDHTIVLTECDLFKYGFLRLGQEISFEELVERYGLRILDVENARMTYEKLVGQKQDSSRINLKKSPKPVQYGE